MPSESLCRHDQPHQVGQVAQAPKGARPETLLANFQEWLPNTSAEKAKRIFICPCDILIRDAYWREDESSGVRLEPRRRWWLRRNTL